VLGIPLVVFRKATGSGGSRIIVAAGPVSAKVWTYDSWNDTFVAVDIPSGNSRVLSREIVRLYGLDSSSGTEDVVEVMTKEQIGYRLP
jgi:hypothetical protein